MRSPGRRSRQTAAVEEVARHPGLAGGDVVDAQCGEARACPSANIRCSKADSTLRQAPHNHAYAALNITTNVLTNRKVRIKSAQRLRGKTPQRPGKRTKVRTPAEADAAKTGGKRIMTKAEYEAEAKAEKDAQKGKPKAKATKDARAATKRPTGERAAKGAKRPSGLDAAAKVLAEAGEPLGCKEMVERMLAKGYWQTQGKTPAATIYAAMLRERQKKGGDSRFRKVDRGKFALNLRGRQAGA